MDAADSGHLLNIDELEDLLIDEQDVPSEDECDPSSSTITDSLTTPAQHSPDHPLSSAGGQSRADVSGAPLKRAIEAVIDVAPPEGMAPVVSVSDEPATKRLLLSSDLQQRRAHDCMDDSSAAAIMRRIRTARDKIGGPESDAAFNNTSSRAVLASCGRVHTRMPSSGCFQKLTYADGRRLYLTVQPPAAKLDVDLLHKKTGLLSTSFAQLKQQAITLGERAVMRRRQIVSDDRQAGCMTATVTRRRKPGLWTDHFQPRVYTELISDEMLNRGLLRWLKLWDKLVFGRDVVKPTVKSDKKHDDKPAGLWSKWRGSGGVSWQVEEQCDEVGRPSQRAALLSGPPGLGKTTLAHVLATHAGYNVVEMNASDDRSVAALRTTLHNCTQMRPLLTHQSRPNCLIIDEIDGAPAPTINYLVSVLTAKHVTTAATSGGKSRKRQGPAAINRPVICICNDLYTQSLRPLRQVALVMPFSGVSAERLATRLLDVCRAKQLDTDLRAMLCLCDKTSNDVRSCLSYLQFVSEDGGELSVQQVMKSNVGLKDHHKGLFSAWSHIFNIAAHKQAVAAVSDNNNNDNNSNNNADNVTTRSSPVSSRVEGVCAVVRSCGEYDRLTQGMFENYLNINPREANMNLVCSCAEWLCWGDLLSTTVGGSQNYSLLVYQVYVAAAVHLLRATVKRCKLNFPHADFEASQRRGRVEAVISSVLGQMTPLLRAVNTGVTMVRDVLPHLLPIISPRLPSTNSQLYKPAEAALLQCLVRVMINYSVTYRQQLGDNGHYNFVLEPDVEQVVCFSGGSGGRSLSYPVKQLVAREIELERVRQAERALSRRTQHDVGGDDCQQDKGVMRADHRVTPSTTTTTTSHVTNDLPNVKCREACDFFGRRIISKPAASTTDTANADTEGGRLLRSDVWYHFKEGYNNAVRKTVRLRDLV